MAVLIRNVSFAIAIMLAVFFLVSLFTCKRDDVSWPSFLLAGPIVLIMPSRYLRAGRLHVPITLFGATMLLFAVVWFASWYVDNSR